MEKSLRLKCATLNSLTVDKQYCQYKTTKIQSWHRHLHQHTKNAVLHWVSQNHRMIGVGRELWGPSSPTLPPKQSHLEQVAQEHIQAAFERLQRRRLHNPSGQLFQCSVTLKVKNYFLMFRWKLFCFSLCPLTLPCCWAPLKRVCSQPSDIYRHL